MILSEHSFAFRPAVPKAITDFTGGHSTDFPPLCKAVRFSVQGDGAIGASVSGISFAGGPAAVLQRVVAVVVDAVQFFAFGSRPHIREEVFKLPPASANRNASRPVVGEGCVFGVAAALEHRIPTNEGRRVRHPVGLKLGPATGGCFFVSQTAAALGQSLFEGARTHYFYDSAKASHLPSDATFSPVTETQNGEAFEGLAGEVLKSRHSFPLIIGRLLCQ